ncbi:MAG: M20/M25/M40 family metallo-hydrolase [Chlamydiia bacterium]|nr:M20/M25/M40 family metallo-hydrolase [Chlamydiia bacterium]
MTSADTSQATLFDWYTTNEDRVHKDYFRFLSYESISTDPDYKDQVLECAGFVEEELRSIGFAVERWTTSGHPTLYAEWLKAGTDKPTVLIYNHYDVQPVDPLELWKSPPFEPTVRDGEVYARGAQDNKGQCWYTLQALKALMERDGALPVNIKLCIEGEEECGSAGLAGILKQRAAQLRADFLLVVDVGIHSMDAPSITLGTRGLVAMTITATGSNTDMHSGSYGGIAYNPNHALIEILAKLRDADGRITVPGFYEGVQEPSAGFDLDFDTDAYRNMFESEPTGGEKAYPPGISGTLRPTLEVNGISGGYTGPGFKTVIPAQASAKVSCRLVPGQDPHVVGERVARHIESLAPKGVTISVALKPGGGIASQSRPDSAVAQAFRKAYEEVFQKPCASIVEGGSIPIAADLAKTAGAETLFVGLALPGDAIHAPNEHFGLDRLKKGFLIVARGLEHLGQTG